VGCFFFLRDWKGVWAAAGRAPDDVTVATRRRLVRAPSSADGELERLLAGDAGAIAATVAELEDAGVDHLVVEIPGSTEAELLENLDWFAREVLPEVRHA
jgi:hypothetical protein